MIVPNSYPSYVSRRYLIDYTCAFLLLMNFISTQAICAALVSNTELLEETAEIEQLLRDGDSRAMLKPRTGAGTSVYVHLYLRTEADVDGNDPYELRGAILPDNSATSPLGEVFSYNLARALGVEEISAPAAHLQLAGRGFQEFRRILQNESFRKGSHKENNRQDLLEKIRDGRSISYVFKPWDSKPFSVDELVTSNRLNERHPIARSIKADQPQPGNDSIQLEAQNDSRSAAVDFARQLSAIMVIDMLTGQWDRFSGGNLEAVVDDGKTTLVAYDNGGTFSWSEKRFQNYKTYVTRFDKDVAARVLAMNDFLSDRSSEFLGFTSEDDFKREMGMDKSRVSWSKFKVRLSEVASHISDCLERYGPDKAYFQRP